MAETVKKATTPRKPSTTAKAKTETTTSTAAKPATKKVAAPKAAKTKVTPIKGTVTHDEIAALAHRFWLERGGQHGYDAEDWIRAEQTVFGKAS